MTPSSDLVECTHCDSWFAGTSLDDLFLHGTGSCRMLASPSPPIGPRPDSQAA